jgi:NADH:ubiquinone oxidoreductase subunit F (NADH-binding)
MTATSFTAPTMTTLTASVPVSSDQPLSESAHQRLDDHLRHLGPVPWGTGLVAELESAGLTGRGGGGFPVARKLTAAASAATDTGRTPLVVANAAEGEPASCKDRWLLADAPHLVLDGLQLVAAAIGADQAHLVVAPDALTVAQTALRERGRERVDLVPVEVTVAEDRFVAGEESAVVAALEGRPALPGDKLRRVVESGVHGRPTVVQNVESLAHVALIARFGAAWFRSRGTATEPGTALVTVSGAVERPGVLEVAHGTALRQVLERVGLRHSGPLLVGGFHGAWLAPHEVDAALFSRDSLGAFGASTGAGVLIVLPPSASGMVETARIAAYLAGQSARQCGPCFNGLPRMAELLARVTAGDPDPRLVDELHRLTGLTAGRGACHHPDGTVRLVRSALRVFGPGHGHDRGYDIGAIA